MKSLFFLLTCFWGLSAQVAQSKLPYSKFKYDYSGLSPKEIVFQTDSLQIENLYNELLRSLLESNSNFRDEIIKIKDREPNKSFIVKGKRLFVFCGESYAGPFCLDAKYEILFQFKNSQLVIKPLSLKRGTNLTNTTWSNVPFDKRANFYKKDGTLKKQCSNGPEAVEDIFNRVVVLTYASLTDIKTIVSN
jgi:hypothetical protein